LLRRIGRVTVHVLLTVPIYATTLALMHGPAGWRRYGLPVAVPWEAGLTSCCNLSKLNSHYEAKVLDFLINSRYIRSPTHFNSEITTSLGQVT
jgi:hypothetical protein